MEKNARNYAFIDAQNLNLGIQELGWKLDYRKFRRYLREKYASERSWSMRPTNRKGAASGQNLKKRLFIVIHFIWYGFPN